MAKEKPAKDPIARALVAKRWAKTPPEERRKPGPRCPCEHNTLKRARARAFDCCRKAGIAAKKIAQAKGKSAQL